RFGSLPDLHVDRRGHRDEETRQTLKPQKERPLRGPFCQLKGLNPSFTSGSSSSTVGYCKAPHSAGLLPIRLRKDDSITVSTPSTYALAANRASARAGFS